MPTPLIAAYLFAEYHATLPIAGYIAATALLSLVCAVFLGETYRRDLTVEAAAPATGKQQPVRA